MAGQRTRRRIPEATVARLPVYLQLLVDHLDVVTRKHVAVVVVDVGLGKEHPPPLGGRVAGPIAFEPCLAGPEVQAAEIHLRPVHQINGFW